MSSEFSKEELEWVLGKDATFFNIQALEITLRFCKQERDYFDEMLSAKEMDTSEGKINRLMAELKEEFKKQNLTGTLTHILEQEGNIDRIKRKSESIKEFVKFQIKILEENGIKNKTLLHKEIAPALARYMKGDDDPFGWKNKQ